MNHDEMRAFITKVKTNLTVTKVVCTRSVKGKMGDSYVGFSAAWRSTQEDGGQGLMATGSEGDEATALGGMSLKEATVAACLVAREADIAAHNHALAGGNIGAGYHATAIKAITHNYNRLILEALNGPEETGKNATDNNAQP